MKITIYNFYESLIINNIDFEGYDVPKTETLLDKINNVHAIFLGEYVHKNNEHLNQAYLFAEWLKGLPTVLTVPFMYVDILERAETFYKANTDKHLRAQLKDEETFLTRYWVNIATSFFTLKNNL